MTSLMKIGLARNTLRLDCFVNPNTVLWHHVPVIERVGHQRCCFQWSQSMDVITFFPKIVVVTVLSIKSAKHFLVPHLAVTIVTTIGITTVNEVVKHIDVLSHVASRMTNQTV